MVRQRKVKPGSQAAHSSNVTVGRSKVETAANLSIESIMENKFPLGGTRNIQTSRWQRGFTLIELLVTMTIAAIVLTIAVPNFITFVQNNRLTSQANDVVTALNYARSEAIKRGVRVTVCSRSTDTACAGSTTWDTGWLVFVDADGDGDVDGETPLQVRQPLESGNTMRAAQRQRVTYQNTGYSGFADTFRLCDARGTASGRPIVVNMQGRVSINPSPTTSCP